MTHEQIEIASSFMNVVFLPGSWDKRFAQSMIYKAARRSDENISESMNEWLYRLLYKYRKQVPNVYEKYRDNPLCSRKPLGINNK